MKNTTPQLQTLLGLSLIEILSRHLSDEVYLGERATPEWTKDTVPLEVIWKRGLEILREKLLKSTKKGNGKHCSHLLSVLNPTSEVGIITGKGIPNKRWEQQFHSHVCLLSY